MKSSALFVALVSAGLMVPTVSFAGHVFSIGVIADLNGTECQEKYPSNSIKIFKTMLANHNLDHLIMTGDAVHGECPKYSGSTSYTNVVKAMWKEFDKYFFQFAKTAQGLVPVITPGNHDAPYLSSTSRETYKTENQEFKKYWMDRKSSLGVDPIQLHDVPDNYPYSWAYKKNDILFVVLQSTRTSSLSNGDAQKKWLKSLFASDAAKSAHTKIVYGHVPPYPVLDPSVGSKYSEVISSEQIGKSNSLTDLLINNHVDLFVVGHSHAPYPGSVTRKSDGKSLKILSMPCGHAPRTLYSKSSLAPRGFAVINVDSDTGISMNIRTEVGGDLIPYSYFPNSIPQSSSAVKYSKISQDLYK